MKRIRVLVVDDSALTRKLIQAGELPIVTPSPGRRSRRVREQDLAAFIESRLQTLGEHPGAARRHRGAAAGIAVRSSPVRDGPGTGGIFQAFRT